MKILFHLLLLVGCVLALCMRRPRYFVSAEFFLPSPAPNSTLSSLEPTFTPFSSAPTSTISSSAPTSTLASKAWHSTLTSSAPTSSPFSPATTSSFVASFEQVPAHVALSKEAKFSTRSSRKAASNKLSKAKALKKVKGTKVKRSAKLKLLVGAVVTTLAVATTAGVLLWHFLSKKEEQPGDAQPVASASTTTKGISGSGPASAKAPAEADAKGAPSKQKGKPPTGRKPRADTRGQARQPVETGSEPTKPSEATKLELGESRNSQSKPSNKPTKPSKATPYKPGKSRSSQSKLSSKPTTTPETAKPELVNPLSSQSKPGSKPAKTPERAEPIPDDSHTPQPEPSKKPAKSSQAKKPKPGETRNSQSKPGSEPPKTPEPAKPDPVNPLDSQSSPGGQQSEGSPGPEGEGSGQSQTPTGEAVPSSTSRAEDAPIVRKTVLASPRRPNRRHSNSPKNRGGGGYSGHSTSTNGSGNVHKIDSESENGFEITPMSYSSSTPMFARNQSMQAPSPNRFSNDYVAQNGEQYFGLVSSSEEEDEDASTSAPVVCDTATADSVRDRGSDHFWSELKNTEKPWTGYNPQQPGRPREHAAMKGLIENETIVQFMKSKSNFTPESETLLRGMLAESV
eukprot:GHVT01020351.1.p1 GENE.GHVT01020351.1~~GHVT01020351.1.p1  ORF type:complete len:625 (+),score=70.58 GHVT01020351.1:554-2428(+)